MKNVLLFVAIVMVLGSFSKNDFCSATLRVKFFYKEKELGRSTWVGWTGFTLKSNPVLFNTTFGVVRVDSISVEHVYDREDSIALINSLNKKPF